jgi:transcriptional regulator with XRE-family HTH domain
LASRLTTHHPIGKRLKQARLAAGLSQARLGVLAGIDQSVASARINQYERQRHQPAFEVVRRLARVLKKPAPYFYANDDALAELISLYGALSPSEKTALLTRVREGRSE